MGNSNSLRTDSLTDKMMKNIDTIRQIAEKSIEEREKLKQVLEHSIEERKKLILQNQNLVAIIRLAISSEPKLADTLGPSLEKIIEQEGQAAGDVAGV